MVNLRELKRQIIRICHLLAEKDYVSAMDGNVSARLPDGHFLTTPTMVHKAFVSEADLLVVDAQGKKLQGPAARMPTSEIFMHLAAYRSRPEIKAVVHAHPPTAIAFTLAGESLARCVLPEVVLTLGSIPTAPYRTTGSLDLAELTGEMFKQYDALVLERHGVISIGTDLVDALGKMEKVEHTAMITLKSRMLGQVRELHRDEVEKLRQLGRKYSSTGEPPPICEGCGGCSAKTPWQEKPSFAIGRVSRTLSTLSEHPTRTRTAGRMEISEAEAVPSEGGLLKIVTEEVVRALYNR